MTLPDLASALRSAGHRVTEPRRAIHAALVAHGGHLTADEVAERAGDVNPATVYRALDVLETVGIVRSVRLGDTDSVSWELRHPDDHAHLVCTTCGQVVHHVGSTVGNLREHLDEAHGFVASGVELVVSGTCARCRGLDHGVLAPDRPRDEVGDGLGDEAHARTRDQASGARRG